jgi:hypothetical protein
LIPLAINGVGACTAVGEDAPITVASLYTNVQLLDDLPVEGADGEPVSGAVVPLPTDLTGADRLLALGMFAAREATASVAADTDIALVVCAPPLDDFGVAPDQFLERLAIEASISLDTRWSRAFATGPSGLLDALPFIVEALQPGQARAACLLGVDSLVAGTRLEQVLASGLIPGEGAVALLLLPKSTAETLAQVRGLGFHDQGADATPVRRGTGLAAAAGMALSTAKARAAELTALIHDIAGPQSRFEELAWASTRAPLNAAPSLQTFAPATSVGDVGSAAGVLSLAMLAFLLDKHAIASPGLALITGDGTRRCAVLLAKG